MEALAMEPLTQFSTVDNQGTLRLPDVILDSLGLKEGTRVALTVHHGQIVISPISAEQEAASRAWQDELDRYRDLVAAAKGPTSSEILRELRQEQEERDLRLLG